MLVESMVVRNGAVFMRSMFSDRMCRANLYDSSDIAKTARNIIPIDII